MGSLLLVIGSPDDPSIGDRLRRMAARSPHRGETSVYMVPGLAMGVQSLGWDSSLARTESAVVAFHGFVGNWDELRDSSGLRFDAGADHAENIAANFGEIGEKIFPLLRGEFAVLVHDLHRSRVIAARDVVGCRPLYVQQLDGRVLLASEVRQVVAGSGKSAELNLRAFANHLVFEPMVGTETLVREVDCVMPGEVYAFSLTSSGPDLRREQYWRLEDVLSASDVEPDDWLDELAHRTRQAVRRWLPGHPSALTLSGGLDSSALWAEVVALRNEGYAAAERVRPVSVYYPGFPCDEREYVERTLRNTGDRGLTVDGTQESAVSLRRALFESIDTVPFPTAYSVHMMAECVAGDERRTVLTGHFADQLFDIRPPRSRERIAGMARVVLSAVLGKRLAADAYSGLKGVCRDQGARRELDLLLEPWKSEIKMRRWERSFGGASPFDVVSRRLRVERTGWSLQSWEQICARFGVEVRHPFCDPDLIAWAATAPRVLSDSALIKQALRRVYRHRLADEIVGRLHKVAFDSLAHRDAPVFETETPRAEWLLVKEGIVNSVVLDSLLDVPNNEGEDRKTVLWIESVESCAQHLRSGERPNRMGANQE